MPENTTSTETMGLLDRSLDELATSASGLSVDATLLLERFDRLAEKVLGDVGPQTDEYWLLMDIRLGLERLGTDADHVSLSADFAKQEAEGLTELVKVVERLRAS